LNEAHPAHMPLDDLMAAEGYVPASLVARAHNDQWLGSLPQVEMKLRELRPCRDDAVARRDAVLAEFDARRDMNGASV
jgi:hypothetical protein